MYLVESPVGDLASLPPWVALLVVLGPAALAAAAPLGTELVKRHRDKDHDHKKQPQPAKEPVAWIETTIRDAWRQRDDATRRAERLQRQLDAEERKTAALAIEIERLRGGRDGR